MELLLIRYEVVMDSLLFSYCFMVTHLFYIVIL